VTSKIYNIFFILENAVWLRRVFSRRWHHPNHRPYIVNIKSYCPALKHKPHYIDIVHKKESEIYFHSLVLIIIFVP
jgi:hypothetical protein